MVFYISWGTKSYLKSEGIAADFCPICRRANRVDVLQIRSQDHVYNIGIGKGDLVGRLCRCLECGTEWALQAGTIKGTADPSARVSLQTLLAETFPRFSLVHGDRLRVEEAVRRDPFSLDAQTRLDLIGEPFLVLDNDMRKEQWETQHCGLKTLSNLACILCAASAIAAAVAFWGFGFTQSGPLWGAAGVAGAVFFAWLAVRLNRAIGERFLRQRIYPRLAACLAPLDPTPDELTRVKYESDSICAARTRFEHFLPLLQEGRDRAREARSSAATADR